MSREDKELTIRLAICLALLALYMATVFAVGENTYVRIIILIVAVAVVIVPRRTEMEPITRDEVVRWKTLGWILLIVIPLLLWLPKYLFASYRPDVTVLILIGFAAMMSIDKLKIRNKDIEGIENSKKKKKK